MERKKGCRVALIGRTPEKLQAVEARIRAAGGTCLCEPCDVTDEKSTG